MQQAPVFADVNGTRIAYRRSGHGYPVLLLHGYPQTMRMWRRVVPSLAARFDVVAMDLRGYGDSARPPAEAGYDKRTMAGDALALARHLGWNDKFLVVGHDRGARAARRLAADHPEALSGAMLLDIMPMEWVFSQGPGGYARRYWHWYFQLQRGLAEQLIRSDPRAYAATFFARSRQPLDPDDVEHYLTVFAGPGAVEAGLADYRAAFDVDRPRWGSRGCPGPPRPGPVVPALGPARQPRRRPGPGRLAPGRPRRQRRSRARVRSLHPGGAAGGHSAAHPALRRPPGAALNAAVPTRPPPR